MKYWLIFIFIFLGFSGKVLPQSAAIEGRIFTDENKPLQDVSVKILNSHFEVLTNAKGVFNFPEVPSGLYIINFQKEGYSEENKRIELKEELFVLNISMIKEFYVLGEVTVTAQKREELSQNIPLSITSLSNKAIEDSGIQNLNDLTAIVPNLYASDPGDRRSVISIRGIVNTSYDPAIATYIDGVNQFNLDTNIPQLFDVERVEVLRGPQGTLYGRNAMGGVINVITKQPRNKTSYFGEATLGSYGMQRNLAGIKMPLIKNKLFFGAAGLFERSNGFYTNEFDNSLYDRSRSFTGNYYLQYLLIEHWNITFNLKHIGHQNHGAFPLTLGIEEAFENPFKLSQNQVTEMADNSLNTSFLVNYSGSKINFTSQSSYQKNYRYYKKELDADFSPLNAISIFNNYGPDWNKVEVGTQEFKFSSPAGKQEQLKWTTGLFLFYQESPVKQAVIFGEDAELLGVEDSNFSLINSTKIAGGGVAAYGQVDYKISSKLELNGGLRYDFENKKQSVLGKYQRNADPNPLFEFQKDTASRAEFSAFSPRIGLTYFITDKKMVYLLYSRGFRAGGLTPLSSDPSQIPLYAYEPEYSNNFELGFKNSFLNKKLLINLSLYYVEVNNVQVPTLILPDAVTIVQNTGRLISKGGELEIKALLFKGFELSYDLGITNARYANLITVKEGQEENLKGKKQIFTPAATSMTSLQYNYLVGVKDPLRIFVRGEWKYLGLQYFDLENQIKQDDYSLFHGHMGIELQNWKLTIWGRNVLDKKFLSYAYDFGAVKLGDPATFGATLNYRI